MTPFSSLIVSGDSALRSELAKRVSAFDLNPICCVTAGAASEQLNHHPISIVICDDRLPDGTFRTLVGHAKCRTQRIPVVVMSRRDDWASFLDALDAGAYDYVALPPSPGELERIVLSALNELRVSGKAGAPAYSSLALQKSA